MTDSERVLCGNEFNWTANTVNACSGMLWRTYGIMGQRVGATRPRFSLGGLGAVNAKHGVMAVAAGRQVLSSRRETGRSIHEQVEAFVTEGGGLNR